MLRICLATAIATGAFGVTSLATPGTALASDQCVAAMSGTSKGKRKKKAALRNAKRDWQRKVRRTWGRRLGDWSLGNNRTGNCNYNGRQYICVMTANPCAKQRGASLFTRRLIPTATVSNAELR